LKHLEGLGQLEEVELRETKVTKAGIEKLKNALPSLRTVNGETVDAD